MVSGWGGGTAAPVSLLCPDSVDQLREAVLERSALIARGMGRSYGDAAQLAGGIVLDTTRLNSFELDPDRGVVTAQGGATLRSLLATVEPAGWVLPVVPGTQHVTVGGAIASDIHGKNHGTAGTFGSHVLELGLLTAAGEIVALTPDDGDLLAATIGGMGLTGVILWARIRLRRMPSASLAVDTDRVLTLDDALAILDGPGGVHRVAWLDLLGPSLVRGVVTRADHVSGQPSDAHTTVSARMTVPSWVKRGVLAPSLVRAFNELRFRRAPRRQRGHIEPFGAHMFPLDVLDAWPRLYGSNGFVQYQLVVPRGQEGALRDVLIGLRRSRVPCYLAVLKDFGPANSAPLSFPLSGWTLALDMPRAAAGLEPLLRGFDELVAAAGGRVYLAKDGRLRPEVLAAMYRRLPEWRAIRDRVDPERRWRSDLALRTGLVDADG
jgi:decaprenylphospho-beta-D-ribofuranose 2-oxidase